MALKGIRHLSTAGIGALLLLVLVLVLGSAMGTGDQGSPNELDLDVDPSTGSLAPDFMLMNLDGEKVSLSQFRGRTVLVNFWATWCGPCRIEMPAIQSRFEQYGNDNLVVLAVNFDEDPQRVAEFGQEFGLSFELLLDPGAEIQRLYRNRSYPTSFFIDPQGVIKAQHIGVMTEGQLDAYLEQLGITP